MEFARRGGPGPPRPPPGSTLKKSASGAQSFGARFRVMTSSTGPEENSSRYLASRGCFSTPGCGKAGERRGSTCAIDVEGHKRRPPSKVARLCHEFRVQGLGMRVRVYKGLGIVIRDYIGTI